MQSPVTPAEASRLIARAIRPLGVETVPLTRAIGRVLREPLVADRPQPPFRRATMDGIAFSSAGLTGNGVKLAGLHAAGDPPPPPLAPGEAWEIMTGAAVPDDCDTLVPYEEVEIAGGHAELTAVFAPGQCIHATGSDAQPGDLLVSPGAKIGPLELAIAASIGKTELLVSKRPAVTVITTGDEVIPVGDMPEPWQIRRSNGPMLEALLRAAGLEVALHHAPDDETALAALIDEALANSDLLLLCGGISKGKRDYVRPTLEARLGAPAFHGVWQRPGKPLAFWSGETPVFALPGNPVSVLVTFTRYVRPALDLLQGNEPTPRAAIPLARTVKSLPKLTWLLPARLDENGHAIPMPPQNSGDFISIAGATHLLEIPPGGETLPIDYPVPAHSLFC
jgi:molybdopterin molybdotransferase